MSAEPCPGFQAITNIPTNQPTGICIHCFKNEMSHRRRGVSDKANGSGMGLEQRVAAERKQAAAQALTAAADAWEQENRQHWKFSRWLRQRAAAPVPATHGYCAGCPDHEACYMGAPCDHVKAAIAEVPATPGEPPQPAEDTDGAFVRCSDNCAGREYCTNGLEPENSGEVTDKRG